METKSVNSSNLETVAYDPETEELQIEFKGGGLYAYDSVPPTVYAALMAAKSVGSHFHKEIKNKYNTRKLK